MRLRNAGDHRARAPGSGVTAVLGPTNTGKTHLAVERMLGHASGMIGLPLRLLAREVYDRVAARAGGEAVALITGEEKIVPAAPRYYVSTVEAMPLDVAVDFLAIDEIQLAGDSERGHIFTDRLLHARGTGETMLLGAATMQGLIAGLLPGANFISRPRMSSLAYVGPRKLTRLARRSVVVAFSADRVYAIAELLRRQRGGAAVVMGALSPRTRNAQVELFQSGDVDFLVATDAIGMGLNMDVDHVSFSERRKFDGARHRFLAPAELAQIAGRAGRHMNDGTFGSSGDEAQFDAEIVDRIENHRFDPVTMLQWRNRDLDFRSLERLIASLAVHPGTPGLIRTRRGDDYAALEYLARSDDIAGAATSPASVELLWRACQLPDYRKIGIGEHAAIVARVFQFLAREPGMVPEEWLAGQVAHADNTDGDIDTLANRISHIRTWTFIANQSGWLGDPRHWQERTRSVEDRLSDALHERLTQRFVDRRTSVLMRRMREKAALEAGVSDDGDVVVEGEHVGRLVGLSFALDGSARAGADSRALQSAAMKVMAGELSQRAQAIAREDDAVFAVGATGYLTWRGTAIARLEGGDTVLRPRLRLIADEQLAAPERDRLTERLEAWLAAHLRKVLEPLFAIESDGEIAGLARGVGFRLVENLGLLAREAVAGEVRQLGQDARRLLRRHGVRFGAYSLHVPALIKPQPSALRLVLYRLFQEASTGRPRDDWPEPPQAGLTSLDVGDGAPAAFYAAAGYILCGRRVVRADMLERLGDAIRQLVGWKPAADGAPRPDGAHASGGFVVTPLMMSLVGCSGDDMGAILEALGYRRRVFPAPLVVASLAPGEPTEAAAPGEATSPAASPEAGAEPAERAGAQTESARVPPAETFGGDAGLDAAFPSAHEAAASLEAQPSAPAPGDGEAEPAAGGEQPAPPAAGIEVWRLRPRQRPRPPRQSGMDEARRSQGSPAQASGADGERKGRGRRRSRPSAADRDQASAGPRRHQPRAPEFDKDSPFAALKALKERLEADGDRPSS
jgi:ATP-dependent RNA helicase SUPV3L1/SUV3